jgi:hypothetical protein
MTIAVSLFSRASRPFVAGGGAGGGDLYARFLLTPSGNYVTGGDAVDLRGFSIGGIASPFEGFIFTNTGYVTHYYTFIPDTVVPGSRANCKMKVTVAATQAEHAAAGYAAGILSDVVVCDVVFRFPE